METCNRKPDYYSSCLECIDRERESIQTNARYKDFDQTHFTAGDVDQFQENRNQVYNIDKVDIDETKNIFKNLTLPIPKWEKYENLTDKSVDNTFNYLFHKFKKGLFIQIRKNKLKVFLPFSNRHFINEWSHKIAIDPKYDLMEFIKYVQLKGGHKFNPKGVNKQYETWYCNNSLVRYEYPLKERDTNISIISDMLKCLVQERELPDFEFFVNRRDFPLFKLNSTEPYSDMFDDDNLPLLSHNYDTYSPIFSMVGHYQFADIPIPTPDDWSRIGRKEGKYFPDTCTRSFEMKSSLNWENKIPKAVFRGSSTGIGTTVETNPRLKLVSLFGKSLHFDVGITAWNVRPRKIKGEKYLKTVEIEIMPFSLVKPLTPNEQANYKYIIHIQGHVEAFRLSLELESKSCILLVESDYKLWYSHLLKPYEHYVPVKRDLSDLEDRLEWCMKNDGRCKKIAEQAYTFSQTYLTKKGILDYLQMVFYKVKKMNGNYIYYTNIIKDFIKEKQLQKITLQIKSTKSFVSLQKESRTFGFLKGVQYVLSCTRNIKQDKKLFSNTNTEVYLSKLGNYSFVVKKGKNLIHEAFVAMNCTNNLAKYVPNFAYTFCYSDHSICMEYVPGISLFDYIHSDSFDIDEFENILKQIANALHIAQNRYAFVHYDLTPWNIILREENKTPVIIDMGRSHVVYENQHYGTVKDLEYTFNPNQDIYTLLVTSLWEILTHNLNSKEIAKVMYLSSFIGNFKTIKELKNFLYKNKNFTSLLYSIKPEIKFPFVQRIYDLYGPNPVQVFEFAFSASEQEKKKTFENLNFEYSEIPEHIYLLLQKTIENNEKEYERNFGTKLNIKRKLDESKIIKFKIPKYEFETTYLKLQSERVKKIKLPDFEELWEIDPSFVTPSILVNCANLGTMYAINNYLYDFEI